MRDWFADLNVMLVRDDEPIATGWGVPIRWNGEVGDLPSGYTDTTRRAVELRECGGQADTFVICGRILGTAPHSQTMTGTVEQWESWTSMPLPSTGHYVIPHGLSPLYIDREADLGTYTEPNIWVQHR
ncbi:hypothetical protein [Nocardioides sp.]|uniref:hypothetical protein n=1 Tax=Nocardioides sp. TaxID=35761 RepID=UPI0039E585EB